jgi:hypothetical protein
MNEFLFKCLKAQKSSPWLCDTFPSGDHQSATANVNWNRVRPVVRIDVNRLDDSYAARQQHPHRTIQVVDPT